MPDDPNIPVPTQPESPRAIYQALAERLGVLAPGAPLPDELLAFAEAVARMGAQGRIAGAGSET